MLQTPTPMTDSTTGTVGRTLVSTSVETVMIIACQNLDLISAGAITQGVPFAFTVVSALWRTNKPATTASKGATVTLSTSAGAVTGGVMTLTSANQNTQGGTQAASAISGANATAPAGGTIILTPSAVTTFVEGDGWCEVTLIDNDLANSLASINNQINLISKSLGS